MKKLFVMAAMISCMVVPFYGHSEGTKIAGADEVTAKDKPTLVLVEVEKTNGGYWAAINLYKEITFTATYHATEQVVEGHLHCEGDGYSRCAVPRDAVRNAGPVTNDIFTNPEMTEKIYSVVDELIEKSVQRCTKSKKSGTASKKIAVMNKSKGAADMLYFMATWQYDANYNGKVSIQISKDDFSSIPTFTTSR